MKLKVTYGGYTYSPYVKLEFLNPSGSVKVVKVKSDDAVQMSQTLCRKYGLMVGISSGANILGVIQTLDKIGREKVAVTVLPDRTERYFSTDLHIFHEHLVRRCGPGCECIFV